jgi:dihydroorotase
VLIPISHRFSRLRIVFEHITTREAVDFVKNAPANVGATITVHHMLFNRNALFARGIRPHHYCLPILKREFHRCSVVEAAISGNPKFFLGTDSAPHSRRDK